MEKGTRLKVSFNRLEETKIELWTPGYNAHGLSTTLLRFLLKACIDIRGPHGRIYETMLCIAYYYINISPVPKGYQSQIHPKTRPHSIIGSETDCRSRGGYKPVPFFHED